MGFGKGDACKRNKKVFLRNQSHVGVVASVRTCNDAGYARPYQMADFLKGTTPQNGYKPVKSYTIEVKVSDGRTYQNSNDYQTQAHSLTVLTKGKSNGSEIADVLNTLKPDEPSEGKYFIVFNSPGLYSQVQAVSFANPFQGLE